jgi:uncharacterized peroxidase-related enzyme
MNKIKAIRPETASEAVQASMEVVHKKLGRVPNMYQVMANSPAVLEAYVKLNGALSTGSLGNKMAELIALATAEKNACSYCLSAHHYFSIKIGLTDEQIENGRKFYSENDKFHVGLQFAKKLLETPNQISNDDIAPLRNAGFSDGDMLEIIAHVIRNVFTNYVNIVSATDVDWDTIVTPNTPSYK